MGNHFSLGQSSYQAAMQSPDAAEKSSLLKTALDHFARFLQGRIRKGDQYFYAYLSSGIIMQVLSYEWKEVERMFLLAYESTPTRGESIKEIIKHYISEKKWPVAYIFTLYARDHFLGNPPANNNWGVDRDFYNWKVLDYHAVTCLSLGKTKEANSSFSLLYQHTLEHPELFSSDQIKQIYQKQQYFLETKQHD